MLSLVSLAQDSASEMLYPLLPLLLTGVLAAPVALVGIIEGIAEGAAAIVKYISGRVSDRAGRKPLVASGYGLAALGKVIIAASVVWQSVLLGRVVDRIGKGIRGAPRDALLAEDIPAEAMGRVYGFHRAADTLGAVIGPALGLAVLAAASGNVRVALWVAIIPAVLSVALVFFTEEGGPRKKKQQAVEQPAPRETAPSAVDTKSTDAKPPRLPQKVRLTAGILAVIAIVNFPDALVLVRGYDLGMSAEAVMGAYLVYNLVYAAASYPAGALADRWPKSRVYGLGLVFFAVGYLGLAMAQQAWQVYVILAVYGLFNGLTDGVGKAWISSLVPPSQRGHAQGLFQGLNGGAIVFAGIWAGLAWGLGPGSGIVPLVISGTVAAISAVALFTYGRRLDPER